MISNRTRGIASLTTACQCVLTLLLFSLWIVLYQLVSGAPRFNLEAYGTYGLFIILGLLFDSVIRDPTPIFGPLRQPNLGRVIPRALRQATIAIGSLLLMLVLSKDQNLSRLFLLTFVPVFYPMILLSAHFLPKLLSRNLFKGAHLERVLLVGSPGRADQIRDWLSAKRAYGVHTVGILTEEENLSNGWLPVLGTPTQLKTVLATQGITHVIYLRLPDPTTDFSDVLETVQKRGVRLVILSDLDAQTNRPTCSVMEDGLTFFSMHPEPLENPFNRAMKRLSDLVIGVPVVLIVLPIATVIVKIIHLLQSPGPLLYHSTRAGIHNRTFDILKFRTMLSGIAEPSRQATAGDSRIFPAGHWLRRFSIDELPQFLNVLSGKMSIVGPRPHLVCHNEQFSELLTNYHARSLVNPGITGLAQVRGLRGETKTQEQISQRVQSDLAYLENWTLTLDLTIMARTIMHMFFPPKSAC
jgi:putative colanic acid biosynthesis UDP-glucose lipid carrier transferase